MKNEWIDFTNDFDYQKTLYDVLLPNGEIVLRCYPNGGYMHADNGRLWDTNSNIKVRETVDFWGDSEIVIGVDFAKFGKDRTIINGRKKE